MIKNRHHSKYEDYIEFQKTKTSDPEKRSKWLGEEWNTKLESFKEQISKISQALGPDKKVLCIGARTGQEVEAFKQLGVVDVIGIDLVENLPLVREGDMNCLDFSDNTFDIVYTNSIEYSSNIENAISEMERVVKIDGHIFIQCRVENKDEFAEYKIENPIYDILPLTNKSFCIISQVVRPNPLGLNFEIVLRKDKNLSDLYEKHGNIKTISVPDDYMTLWNEINLPIQNKKLDNANIISRKARKKILNQLSKRAYYLTKVASAFSSNRFIEVGTAEGWQYFTFCKYVKDNFEDGFVYTCDPRDVRDKRYVNELKDDRFQYVQGTSEDIASKGIVANFFYIDGLHDQGTVIRDVLNLESCQDREELSTWVFDDFDLRFGCAQDIMTLSQLSKSFKVYHVGDTASGNPSHQVIVRGYFKGEQSQ